MDEAVYQVMPDLSAEEFEQLKSDIAARGVMVPVEYDEAGAVLDGHHRVRACKALGIENWPYIVRSGLSDAEKRAHARALNLARRHLSQEQRRELIREQLKDTPAKSDRQIAKALGVSDKTVGVQRAELEESAEIPHFLTRIDPRTGLQSQPATKAPPAQREEDSGGLRHVSQIIDSMNLDHLRQRPDLQEAPPEPLPHNHRAQGSGENEWYTPEQYLTAARKVLGAIDLDPASSDIANKTVRAARFFSMTDDGLDKPWAGRVWMNPPYSQPHIARFAAKLVEETQSGNVSEAIALTHNYTDTAWFHALAGACDALCFTRGRIGFLSPDGRRAAPTQGQAFFYFGPRPSLFAEVFASIGLVLFTPIGAARSDAA